MFKKVSMLLLMFLVLGCGDSTKKMEKKKEEIRMRARGEQFLKNVMKEDISLLAIKYEVHEEQLTEILIEYEKMTNLFSSTEILGTISDKDKPKVMSEKELVDVSTALNQISGKYGIPKKILSTIILEKKMLKTKSGD